MPQTFLSGRRIPGDELAAVAAGAGMADHDRADVRLARLVLHLDAFIVHAEIVGRHVEQIRLRREGDRLLVLAAHRRRTDVLGVLRRRRPLLGVLDRLAGLQVDARRPVDVDEGVGHQQFAGGPVEHVGKAVAIEVHQDFSRLALDVEIDQHVLVDAVVVPRDRAASSGTPTSPSRCRGCARRSSSTTCCRRAAGRDSTIRDCRCRSRRGSGRGRSCTSPTSCRRRVFHSSPFQVSSDPGKPTSASGPVLYMRQICLPVLTSLAVTNPRTPNSPPLMPEITLSLITMRRGGDGLAVLVVALLDLPHFLAGLRIERDGRGIQLILEDLAVGVRQAAIHRVAAGDRDHLRILLRRVLPFDRRAFLGQVEGIDDVRETACGRTSCCRPPAVRLRVRAARRSRTSRRPSDS